MIAQSDLAGKVEVSSAGIACAPGYGMSDEAKLVLSRRGLENASPHISRPLRGTDVEAAQLILTMTMSHKEMIVKKYSDAVGKVYTLREYGLLDGEDSDARSLRLDYLEELQPSLDIADPIGSGYDAYEMTADQIEHACELALHRLRRELGKL